MASARPRPVAAKTPIRGGSEFLAHRDEQSSPPSLVVRVGKTELRYDLRCIDDLHAMLKQQGDWVPLGNADEGKPVVDGSVEAWARVRDQPGRRLLRAAQGLPRPLRQLRAAGARGARPGRGRAQPAQQPHAGHLRPRPILRCGHCGISRNRGRRGAGWRQRRPRGDHRSTKEVNRCRRSAHPRLPCPSLGWPC